MTAAGAARIATPGPVPFMPEPTDQAASGTGLKIVFAN
jgi:hypothetical protein